MAKNIVIYSTPTCHFCHMAKDFLSEHNVPFTDYNVQTDLEKRAEMAEKSGGMAVPVIDVDGEVMVGFDRDRLAQLAGIPA
jgi:glutaredoxin-like YruB-family protein